MDSHDAGLDQGTSERDECVDAPDPRPWRVEMDAVSF